jgi:hypothetical protein
MMEEDEDEDMSREAEVNGVLTSILLQLLSNRPKTEDKKLAPEIEEFLEHFVGEFADMPEKGKNEIYFWANTVLKREEHKKLYH